MATDDIQRVYPKSVLGFNGSVQGGVVAHPDGQHVIYPMATKLVVQDWRSGKQSVLSGHTSDVSALAVSPCGKYLASGQILQLPFPKVSVHIWDFKSGSSLGTHMAHNSTVTAITFSCDSNFVYSLGGLDDHCLTVWDMRTLTAISCTHLAKKLPRCEGMAIAASRTYANFVITSSEEGIKVWEMESNRFTLTFYPVDLGRLKRIVNCMMVDDDDTFLYCGSSTGEVMKVRLNLVPRPPRPILEVCMSKPSSIKEKETFAPPESIGKYVNGVRVIVRLDPKHLAVAAGDGTIDVVEELDVNPKIICPAGRRSPTISALKLRKTFKLDSMITSVARLGKDQLLVGTVFCDIYSTHLEVFNTFQLDATCHPSPVSSLALPRDTSEVFVTSGLDGVRVWRMTKNSHKLVEMHRIRNYRLLCHNVVVAQDGSCIFSAWNDGAIRMYDPESGRQMSKIIDAHRHGVSALGVTGLADRMISGGNEGQVRVWDCKNDAWTLTKTFAKLRGVITHVAIKDTGKDAATACDDGTCYVWGISPVEDDLCGKQALEVSGILSGLCFLPGSDPLLLTSGDNRIVCWDTAQGVALREIETHTAVTSLYVLTSGPMSGRLFATGFKDGLVKVWDLLCGEVSLVGNNCHSAKVNSLALSSDGQTILSACQDGSICSWDCPQE